MYNLVCMQFLNFIVDVNLSCNPMDDNFGTPFLNANSSTMRKKRKREKQRKKDYRKNWKKERKKNISIGLIDYYTFTHLWLEAVMHCTVAITLLCDKSWIYSNWLPQKWFYHLHTYISEEKRSCCLLTLPLLVVAVAAFFSSFLFAIVCVMRWPVDMRYVEV